MEVDEGVPAELTGTRTAGARDIGLSTRGGSRITEGTKDIEKGKIRLLMMHQLIWGFVVTSVNEGLVLGVTSSGNNFYLKKHRGLRKYQHYPSSLNERDHSWLKNFVKQYIKTVRFGNDHFGAIIGYGDYVIGNSMISRVYYVEGLRHNLFFVGQFYDSDLEVAFRKHSCYVPDTDGVELIKDQIMVVASSFKPLEL
uniref:Integrase, catalytic region, zinc finger, CCHC-type, peptidase aspartic, catalytic n=1 Tax=Tanacetum cinerariifolium TaxID=118510 RepID=A0A699LAQ7_TANCI|nr:integrase, catalytic region, zinc finger, CCHC-type, peptidase aspartic, catalytic [Tanacetum cinerariifolium]